MRRYKISSFITFLWLLSANFTIGQTAPGQIIINAGVGYSPGFNGDMGNGPGDENLWPYYPVHTNMDGWGNYGYFSCSAITPNIGCTIDYGLSKSFSIGVASSYQNESVSWGYGLSSVYTGYPIDVDKVMRVNMAFRALFHLIHNEYVDLYTGVRLGSSYWHDSPSPDNIYLTNSNGFIGNSNSFVPSGQCLLGIRIYPYKNMGIHFELGLGSPYLAEGGLSFRINTRQEKPTSVISTPANK